MSESTKNSPENNRKGLELPDFQELINAEASPLYEFLTKYSKIIITAIIVVVVAAAGYAGVKGWASYTKNKATDEFAQILALPGEATPAGEGQAC